jgi:hypothetical protein
MSAEPLRCACCGETNSQEGFVQISSFHNLGRGDTIVFSIVFSGKTLRIGDMLKVECARLLGAVIPHRMPTAVFRCET